MVKIHKPIPKTIKNGGPELKKVQTKIVKANSKKEVAKKLKKVLEVVDTNKTENVKTKVANLDKRKIELLGKMNETVSKKKPLIQKSLQNGEAKKTPALQEVLNAVGKIQPKEKKALAKRKAPVENCAVINSTSGGKPAVKQTASKKTGLESKEQQKSKKPIAKKNSALKEVADETKKDFSKKKLIAAKPQHNVESNALQTSKKPATKKNSALDEEPGKGKKDLSQKKHVAAKQQPTAIKPVTNKNSALEEESGKDKKALPMRKQVAAKQQSTGKKPATKKMSTLEEESGKDKQGVSNKKQVAAKPQKTVKKPAATGEDSEKDKKDISKQKQVTTKVQPTVKKPTAKKNSAPKEESENDKKDLSKKKQSTAIVGQKSFTKKNSALEKKPEESKRDPSKKELAVAVDQQKPVKKSVAKKNTPLVKVSEKVKNISPKQDGSEKKSGKKPLALKTLNSTVQKKLSTGKKNESKLKNKVKKIPQADRDKILKSEQKESPKYESTDFDESKFKNIVSSENIKKAIEALKTLIENNFSKMKSNIFRDYAYFLNVACYKIANCPKRMVKLNLKHSLVDANLDDILLIVPDLKRGAKVDHEPTIQHYEDILRECGLENIKVLPFNQLRNEYSSFEAKRKLANSYDYFLCDGRIVGHVVGICGKVVQKPRTTIHAVNLSNPKNCKKEIEHALKRTGYRQLQKGDLSSILVGNYRFTVDQLAENIEKVIEQLKTVFPGGYANIRNLHIKVDIIGTPSLPLYVSLTGAPDEVPNVIGPREQRMLKLKKQANDILSKFGVTKVGNIVKLNKTEIKRKQDIREAREALTSAQNTEVEVDEEASEYNPPLNKKAKKAVDLPNSVDNEVSADDVDVSEDDVEEDDEENGEASDDDVEEDDEENGEASDDDDDVEVSEEVGEGDEDGEGDDDDDDEVGEETEYSDE